MFIKQNNAVVASCILCGLGLLALTSACSVNPAVKLALSPTGQVHHDSRNLIDSFVLQQNRIRFEFKKVGDQKSASAVFNVIDTRTEDAGHRVLVLRDDGLLSRTTINFTKVENTDLIDTVGVEVEDRRKTFLETAGTVIKTIAPLVMAASGGGDRETLVGCEGFPAEACEFVPTEALRAAGGGQSKPLVPSDRLDAGTYEQGSLAISWGAVPTNAVETKTVLSPTALTTANGIYFAACRNITISYAASNGDGATRSKFVWRGKFADPRWVEYVAFPKKGFVRMHSQCGVSSSSEKDPTDSTDAIIATAVTQAVAVKDAIDKAAKANEK